MFDTQRLAQMGSWSGTLNVAGRDLKVDPATDVGLARPLLGRAPGG